MYFHLRLITLLTIVTLQPDFVLQHDFMYCFYPDDGALGNETCRSINFCSSP